ncbi:MAG: SGNH/GDSL hydrolase family protein [Armatimonadetes bacterium]|nr:SGNH/GDSL hydrolase family protein [Armatimonadota bacterium]
MVVARTSQMRVPPSISAAASKPAPELTMVALGDSLTAGTQDAVTRVSRQEMVYTGQMARAAGIPFNMPAVSEPGIPFEIFGSSSLDIGPFARAKKLFMVALTPLAAWTYYLGAPPFIYPPVGEMLGSGRRIPESRSTPERPQHSFAVAGFEARHLNEVSHARDFMDLILQRTEDVGSLAAQVPLIRATLQNGRCRSAGTQLDQAIAARPDLVVLWAGGNDALEAAFRGQVDDRTLTPVEDRIWHFRDPGLISPGDLITTSEPLTGFRSTFTGPSGLLTRLLGETDAEIVLMNVPNVNVIPNLVALGRPVGPLPFRILLKDGTDVTGAIENMVVPREVRGPGKKGRTHFPPGTRVPLMTLLSRLVVDGPVDNLASFQDALLRAQQGGFLTEDEALDPEEMAQIQARVQQYNDVLRQAAAGTPRIHLVDVQRILNDIRISGRPLRGPGEEQIRVTTTFTGVCDLRGFGGIFSYDGVHPSDTGHAVIANVVLDAIREQLGGNPKFARFLQARPIDEKSVFRADPHQGGRHALVLDRSTIETLILGTR